MLALERYGRVFGVDFSPLALRFCQQRGLDRAFQASVTALPFSSAVFDLVTSFDVLYHLGEHLPVALQGQHHASGAAPGVQDLQAMFAGKVRLEQH